MTDLDQVGRRDLAVELAVRPDLTVVDWARSRSAIPSTKEGVLSDGLHRAPRCGRTIVSDGTPRLVIVERSERDAELRACSGRLALMLEA